MEYYNDATEFHCALLMLHLTTINMLQNKDGKVRNMCPMNLKCVCYMYLLVQLACRIVLQYCALRLLLVLPCKRRAVDWFSVDRNLLRIYVGAGKFNSIIANVIEY